MILKTLIFLLLFVELVHADEWTQADTVMEILYCGFHVADWNQTLQIIEKDGHKEANKILGEYPGKDQVNLYFASTLAGHYYIAKHIDQPYRFFWQIFWINIQNNVVRHNKGRGLQVNFNFD